MFDVRFERACARAVAIGVDQGGVCSRKQLYGVGITRSFIRAQVRARRWQLIGDQSVALHNAELSLSGRMWAAVFQGGPRAHLDGPAALAASGLLRFEFERIRVSVPRGARTRRTTLFDIRQTRRWRQGDVVTAGIPRARPAVAALHGALWAATDRQASLLLSMTVQQRLATAEEIGVALLHIRRDKRRALLHEVVNDLIGGAHSLGELDLARELRRRGLPEPQRQVVRRDRRGRYYLDLYWEEYGLIVEVDGIQHTWAENVVEDALRQNALTLSGDAVLRIPLLGLRLQPDEFFGQIERALRERGYRRGA
ncbi:MAG: DUF559 domain-containing protein [Marmoricola sp.]